MNIVLLTELGRQRQREIAHDVALCRSHCTLRAHVARTIVALGALAVVVGIALDDEPERRARTYARSTSARES